MKLIDMHCDSMGEVFLHPERPYTRLRAEETGRLFEGGAPRNT